MPLPQGRPTAEDRACTHLRLLTGIHNITKALDAKRASLTAIALDGAEHAHRCVVLAEFDEGERNRSACWWADLSTGELYAGAFNEKAAGSFAARKDQLEEYRAIELRERATV